MKPNIGVVAMTNDIVDGRRRKKIEMVNDDYIQAILNAGGYPLLLINNCEVTKELLEQINGLLLIGGEDVSEECFKGKESSNLRDNTEIKLYHYFKNHDKPILGICRGMQVINVAEGGTLANITNSEISHNLEDDGWVNFHDMYIEQDTKIYELIESDVYPVSSVHHQKIEQIGENVKIAARAKDGVAEAIEIKDKNFIIGFQGHIEKCVKNYSAYQRVFKKFVDHCL